MERSRPEVADVFRDYGERFLDCQGQTLGSAERQTLRDIARCRTAALGGHKYRCDTCGYEEISYNSCRNRHCPKCQGTGQAEWLQKESTYLLDVEYFHVVFTLPEDLGPLALRNKRKILGALFRAAAETLSTIALDPKHLGAELGFLMVLHTWGQNLQHHPHIHCVVPGGGLSVDGTRWISCPKGFFLSVRVLSRLFRGKFLAHLDRLWKAGELSFGPSIVDLKDRAVWAGFNESLRQREWVVYSKRPFGGPAQVLKYLARYTHRVAISNRRILSIVDGKVRFSYKDYARGGKRRVMTLEAQEFIRRFLLHVLPKGFVRIRHYGFLSNRSRKSRLPVIRRLIGESVNTQLEQESKLQTDVEPIDSKTSGQRCCPACKQGQLRLLERVSADPHETPTQPPDTS